MPLVTVENLTKYYGTNLILDHVSFTIDHRERLGLIGANGVGKTTLCRILMGQEPYEDDSRIHMARGTRVGYLSQDVNFGEARTPWEVALAVYHRVRRLEADIAVMEGQIAEEADPAAAEVLLTQHAQLLSEYEAAGGYEYERTAARVLTGLGVPETDFHRELSSFSGGERRRVALAQLLLTRPDLLLLDEPTNHLDIAGIEWLEEYLKAYPGAVVVISHDRWFLDAVCQRILEMEYRSLTQYRGGYSAYLQQKEQRLLAYERRYERQQEELKRQLSFIRWALGTGQEKRIRAAKSRMKLLEKLEYLDPPMGQRRKMNLRFQPRFRGGEEILELQGVGKRFADRWLFRNVSLFVRRGERVGIVGPNGCGKTTLLRIALGLDTATEGTARLGRSVEVGYHRQDEFGLTPDNTVFSEFRSVVPDAPEGEVRSLLARFLFVEDEVFKRVGDLSGGEQSRLSLAKLIMTRPTLLVLDEPTNHLDIDSRNSLESALREYQGTIIVVSHDRYFLDSIVHRVLVFTEGTAALHEGNYSAYLAARRAAEEERQRLAAEQCEAARQQHLKQQRLARKAKQRSGNQVASATTLLSPEELEQRAERLETQLAKVRDILGRPGTYDSPAYVAALTAEHARLSEELEHVYDLWDEAEEASGPNNSAGHG